MVAACTLAPSAAFAQANPFVPSSGASSAQIERIVDARIKQLEERMAKSRPGSATVPGVPGAPIAAPGTPGGPVAGAPGSPLSPGVPGAPGVAGPNYPGAVPGQPGAGVPGMIAAPVAPMNPIEEARAGGARFLGCINGVPKFVKRTGERVTFTNAEINRAVKAGILPACR